MQRESSLDRLLQEKMATLLSQAYISKNNTDINALKRSLFEVQVLVKRLYPNNEEASKIILKTRDLFQEQLGVSDKKSIATTEMILGCAKEIAHAIGLESPIEAADGGNGKSELSKNSSHAMNMPKITSNTESSDSLSPSDTAEKVAKTDMQKVNTNTFSTFILAILAGALIAIAGVYFTFATSQIIVTRTLTQVFGGLLFSFGLMAVVITGAQMFTGNNLGIMNIASRRLGTTKLLRNWVIVYAGNFVGAAATAGVLYMSHAWTNNGYQFGIKALMIASRKVNLGFVDAFFLGILCNSLVCLAIYLAASGKKVSDKILAIMFPTAAFIAMGFEHAVANMYFLTFASLIKNDSSLLSAMQTAGVTVDTSHLDYMGIISNLLPVTMGNIVGGGVFVGLMYWLAYMRNKKED